MVTKHSKTCPNWPFPAVTKVTEHPCGQWIRKVHGKLCYAGKRHSPEDALQRHLKMM